MVSTKVDAPPWSAYTNSQRWGYLGVLFVVATSSFFDKNIIAVLLEPIKQEFQVSDTLLGLLSGFSFALFYVVAGIPVARWSDRGNRRTIVTLAVTVWSAMTMLCGLAQSFWQLVLARVAVGAGESGTIPPAHSLIGDYFPPDRRAMAIGIFTAAGTAGYLLGFGVGGYIAATHGWRAAFLLAGAPGVLLALLARFALAEPRLTAGFPGATGPIESSRQTFAVLWGKRTYVLTLAGCVLYTFIVHGALMFIPSFLVRILGGSLAQASVTYGAVAAIASVIGTLAGGSLADRLGARDVRWLAWISAIACGIAGPLYLIAFSMNDIGTFMVVAFFAQVAVTASLPPILATIHAVCGNPRRATAIALMYFVTTLIGSGFGPLVTGAISDALTARHGVNGLRYSLMSVALVLVVAGAVFFRCHRVMPAEVER